MTTKSITDHVGGTGYLFLPKVASYEWYGMYVQDDSLDSPDIEIDGKRFRLDDTMDFEDPKTHYDTYCYHSAYAKSTHVVMPLRTGEDSLLLNPTYETGEADTFCTYVKESDGVFHLLFNSNESDVSEFIKSLEEKSVDLEYKYELEFEIDDIYQRIISPANYGGAEEPNSYIDIEVKHGKYSVMYGQFPLDDAKLSVITFKLKEPEFEFEYKGLQIKASTIEKQLLEQLEFGIYRDKIEDVSMWIVNMWRESTPEIRRIIESIVNNALLNENPEIRMSALRVLGSATSMADPYLLVDIADNKFDLFAGLRSVDDPDSIDRGTDFVRLVASVSSDPHGDKFRHKMALDPIYSMSVLAGLVRVEPDWVCKNITKIVNSDMDPDGIKLGIILFNFRYKLDKAKIIIGELFKAYPDYADVIRGVIKSKITDIAEQEDLLGLLEE